MLRCGRLSEAEVAKLMYQLIPLLSYIHSQVIHRDISQTTLCRAFRPNAVLIDFGGVKQVELKAVSNFTNLGKILTRLVRKDTLQGTVATGQVFLTATCTPHNCNNTSVADSRSQNCMTWGTWVWRREISVSSQLKQCCRKCWLIVGRSPIR